MSRSQDAISAQLLLTLRSRLNLTQTELAETLAVSRRSISSWESGDSYPKADHLKNLVALAVRQHTFPAGQEEVEIRELWKLTRQKHLLDKKWLADLLTLGALSEQRVTVAAAPSAAASTVVIDRGMSVNLPFQPTIFFGRRDELVEIGKILADPACRLLTLIGPGGIGKTRLALEFARSQVDQYADGVFFVALASVGTPNQIVSAIADALNLSLGGQTDAATQVLESLRKRQMLLVLDNFEHLLDGADLVSDLLTRAPQVRLLVTSRERLNLRMEWLLDVEGLAYPPEDPRAEIVGYSSAELSSYSALQLFGQRLTQIQPGFPLDEAHLMLMAHICRQVSGMPLAIELAAAGARMMSLAEIERQIRSNLDVLATTFRDMPARHRSLRAVFDHSWNLLTEPERALLSRLAIFRGGCTTAAAEKVAGATLTGLTALIDKSLLRKVSVQSRLGTHAPEARFALLEPIREYALAKLAARGELERLRRVHADYYRTLAETVAAQWDNPTSDTTIEKLDYEYDNLRAALQWASDGGELAVGFEIGWALRKFWQRRGYYSEGRQWLEALLSHPDRDASTTALRARLRGLHTAAWLATDQHDYQYAAALFEQSRALSRKLGETDSEMSLIAPEARQARSEGQYRQATALFEGALAHFRAVGDRRSLSAGGLGLALYELALALREIGEFDRSAALFAECLELHRALGDREGHAVGLLGISDLARDQGDSERTRSYGGQALAISRELGQQWTTGYALNNLALADYMDQQLDEALTLCDESIALFQSIHADGGLAEMLITHGHIVRARGDLRRASDDLAEALNLARTHGPRVLVAAALEGLACVRTQEGDAVSGTRLLGAASALRAQMGTPVRPADFPTIEQAADQARSTLGPAAFDLIGSQAGDQPLDQLLDQWLEPPQVID